MKIELVVREWVAQCLELSNSRGDQLQSDLFHQFRCDMRDLITGATPKEFARTILKLHPGIGATRNKYGQWVFRGSRFKKRGLLG